MFRYLVALAAGTLLAEMPLAAGCGEPGSPRVAVQVLGSGGPELDDLRAGSGYLVLLDGRARVMVDAGPGSSLNFERSGARFEDLEAILFTHLHVDHSADLPTYVKGAYFSERQRPLTIFGPAGNTRMPATSEYLERLLGPDGAFRYLSDYLHPDDRDDFHLNAIDVPLQRDTISAWDLLPEIRIQALQVHHGPIAALAWRVDAAACSVVFSGDTSNQYGSLGKLARGADLLVAHNAVPQSASGAAARLHMRPSEIGAIARDARVGAVLLSHRMTRTLGREPETLAELREQFSGTVTFAEDLSIIAVE